MRSSSKAAKQSTPPFGTDVAALVYFGLALLYFLPALLPGNHLYGSDYFAGGFFFHEFISERFAAGDLPKWVPYVYGGVPLFSNPGSTYFPVRWLADLVLPVSKLYATMFVVQFGLAGLGTYLLTRELGVRAWIAFVAGLAFQFSGLAMSYVLAGHDGRIIVATLGPLLFFFLHRGVRTGELASFVGVAATVGFALLSFQIQSSYYLLVGGAIWAVFCLVHFDVWRAPKRLAGRLALGLGAVAFGFALAAPNFLPFADYVSHSPRGATEGRGYDYSVSWSMPPDELIGLAVPEVTGGAVFGYYRPNEAPAERPNQFKLHTEYAGAFVIALVLLGAGYARRDRRWWFFLGLTAFALTIAFGGHTPLYRLYYEVLPGTKRFRAPSISFLLVSMSLVTMAALAMEAIAVRLDARPARRPGTAGGKASGLPHFGKWLLGIGGLALLGMLVAAAAQDGSASSASVSRGWLRFAVFLGIVLALLWAWVRGALGPTAVALALAATTVVDLWIIDRKFFETRPGPDETFAADDVVRFLRAQPGPYRVWVLPLAPHYAYGREPNYLMHFDIEQAGGEHGNQLQRFNQFAGAGEQTYVDWHNFLELRKFIDAANVRYVISGVPLEGLPFPTVHAGPGGVVLENPDALPRAWLVGQAIPVAEGGEIDAMRTEAFDFRTMAVIDRPLAQPLPGGPVEGAARVVEYTPDRVVVETEAGRDALLVLADNHYRDWTVRVDGEPAPLYRANHTFRGVRVGAGRHTVEFRFEPRDLYVGLAIYLAGFTLLIGYAAWFLYRRLSSRAAPATAAGKT
ncbi:MAG TPA: YfhO family protein [Longimicrobiales bacterium]|nr:YfhO family protein [Longimicrobiales bacterium]